MGFYTFTSLVATYFAIGFFYYSIRNNKFGLQGMILSLITIFIPVVMVFPAILNDSTIVFIGILFIVSGNYFPKNHINPYVGLKFPWLFNDEEGWYKTHRLGSYTWILAGLVSILHPLHNLIFVTVPLIIFLVGVVPLVYSLVLFFKRKQSN